MIDQTVIDLRDGARPEPRPATYDHGALAALGRFALLSGFDEVLEQRRRIAGQPFEPWVRLPAGSPRSEACGRSESVARQLVRCLHDDPPGGCPGPLAAWVDATLPPSRWQLTSYRGLLAARDRPRTSGAARVYLGEDGMRFTDALLRARLPSEGVALEVGSGSGLPSVALASRGLDVVALDHELACCDATAATAALNGVGDRVLVQHGDLRDLAPSVRGAPAVVVANLPGVPVPPDVRYGGAGDGGPDGLALFRELFERLPVVLGPKGSVIVRFQSIGVDEPAFVRELRRYSSDGGWRGFVVVGGRAPMEVRSALTARNATALDPRPPLELLRLADGHATRLGATSFFACTLVARRSAAPDLHVVTTASRLTLDHRPRALRKLDALAFAELRRRFRRALADPPETYWELGDGRWIQLVEVRSRALVAAMDGVRDLRAVVAEVLGEQLEAQPISGRALYLLVLVLVQIACECGFVSL